MSGPKMVGVTCDPDIIRRNNERLCRIGKVRYFTDFYRGVNTDLENTGKWFLAYGHDILKGISSEDLDDATILEKIEMVKKEYLQMEQGKHLDEKTIPNMSIDSMNRLICLRVGEIPEWKKKFIIEISKLFDELQREMSRTKERKKKEAILQQKLDNIRSEDNNREEELKNFKNSQSYVNEGRFVKRFAFRAAEQDKKIEKEEEGYTLAEQVLIDELKHELSELKSYEDLTEEEMHQLFAIDADMRRLNVADNKYNYSGKRALIPSIMIEQKLLAKQIAIRKFRESEQRQYRSSLEIEYDSFYFALNSTHPDISKLSTDELEKVVDELRAEVEKMEERTYIEEAVTEVMSEYGYNGISTVNLHEYNTFSRIFYENEEENKLSVSFNANGSFTIQVIGEGNPKIELSEKEKAEQLQQQGALCDMYPGIIEALERRHIHIRYQNLTPASKESALNVDIKRDGITEKRKGKHSVLSNTFRGETSVREDMLYEDSRNKLYVEQGYHDEN